MGQRILLVEDEVEIVSYLRRGLAYEGYTWRCSWAASALPRPAVWGRWS